MTLLGLEWKTERSTHVDVVTPGPAMQKYVGWESIEEGAYSNGKFEEARKARDRVRRGKGDAQSRAPKRIEGQDGWGGSVKHSTAWCELKSDQLMTMMTLRHFVGERGWRSTEGLNMR